MKFTIDRAEFEKVVQAANDVVPTKTTLPVLSNVMAKATGDVLELIATDLDVFMVIRVPASIEEDGEFTLPAKRLGDTKAGMRRSPWTSPSWRRRPRTPGRSPRGAS